MADFPVMADAERTAAKRWSYIGIALVAFAFVGPSIVTLTGWGSNISAFRVGEDPPRTLGALAFLGVIAWLIVRRKSRVAKAKALTVVGVLLCIVVGNNIAQEAKEQALSKQYLKDALALPAHYAGKFEDLGRRFDQVAVHQYATPDGLTLPTNVAAGIAAVKQYRSLLNERNVLVQAYLAESAAFIGKLPPGRFKAGAESTFGPSRIATEETYRMMDMAQGEYAAALGDLFTWAQANAGKIGMRNGQMMFTNVAQRQELMALANRLDEAEKAVNDAEQKAQAAREKSVRLQNEAADFLAK